MPDPAPHNAEPNADNPADNPDTSAMRAYLADHDHPCSRCGYNLRGLTGEHCPECRQELALSMFLAEKGYAEFLWILLPLVVVSGLWLGFFATHLMCVSGFMPLLPDDFALVQVYPLTAGIVLLTPALCLARKRGRAWLQQRTPATTAFLVAASVLGSPATVIVWFLLWP